MPVSCQVEDRPMDPQQVAAIVREVDQVAGSLVGVLADLGALRQELEELLEMEVADPGQT